MKLIASQLQQGLDDDWYWLIFLHEGTLFFTHIPESMDTDDIVEHCHQVDSNVDPNHLKLWLKDRLDEWSEKSPSQFPNFNTVEKVTVLITNYDLWGNMTLDQINQYVQKGRNTQVTFKSTRIPYMDASLKCAFSRHLKHFPQT